MYDLMMHLNELGAITKKLIYITMKNYFIISLLIIFSINTNAQSFEGKITFKTEITTSNSSSKDAKQNLTRKYGDSLEIYYSKKGNFKRRYLNTGELGNDYHLFFPDNGKIIFAKNNSTKIDSGYVNTNSITLTEKVKLADEKIMNVDCECYQYKGFYKSDKKANVSYCFSKDTPVIDFKLFEKHKDFFLDDFFKTSQRPYLKFTLETEIFTLTYIATELKKISLDEEMFRE